MRSVAARLTSGYPRARFAMRVNPATTAPNTLSTKYPRRPSYFENLAIAARPARKLMNTATA